MSRYHQHLPKFTHKTYLHLDKNETKYNLEPSKNSWTLICKWHEEQALQLDRVQAPALPLNKLCDFGQVSFFHMRIYRNKQIQFLLYSHSASNTEDFCDLWSLRSGDFVPPTTNEVFLQRTPAGCSPIQFQQYLLGGSVRSYKLRAKFCMTAPALPMLVASHRMFYLYF